MTSDRPGRSRIFCQGINKDGNKRYQNGNTGRIVEKVSNKYVTVRFANLQKVFVYPDAFEVFLSAVDEAVSRDIAADLAAAKEKRKAHDEEIEKAREVSMRGQVSAGPEEPQPTTDYTPLPEDSSEEA